MSKIQGENKLKQILDEVFANLGKALESHPAEPKMEDIGVVSSVGRGIAWLRGLRSVESDEIVRFPGNKLGMALNLDVTETGVIFLDAQTGINAGFDVHRTKRVMDVPVGESLLGRVLNPMGTPLDGAGEIRFVERRPIERDAPEIMERAPVNVPLQTGIQVIDALIPVGRGQRELILGDRQTGKTAIALDTIINQKNKGVFCVYCAIGQENSAVARVVADLRKYGALEYCVIIAATGNDTPGLNFIAPYAATTIAEYFTERGQDALVVYDDLTHHARSYRELSLLLRRPPAREAFPGDIFYIHSRLLERSTNLLRGGSLTALPIAETEAQNISAYIPTNLISITDGQVYLSPKLFSEGMMPAVDVGKSVSRVGGKTQLPAYRAVAGDLRLAYSRFEELESFARFGTRLDAQTQQTLERGRRVREVLKQPRNEPIPAPEQIAVLLAVTSGAFDGVPVESISEMKLIVRQASRDKLPELGQRMLSGAKLGEAERKTIISVGREAIKERI